MSDFKEYFRFSSSERKGILILMILIFMVMLAKWALPFFVSAEIGQNADLQDLVAYAEKQIEDSVNTDMIQKGEKPDKNKMVEYFNFDPNGLSVANWEKMGLSEKQAESIKKYEKKGGKFRSKQDLKKMYVITEEFYNKIEPFILLPETLIFENSTKNNIMRTPRFAKIFINTADSAAFEKLYGIGAVLSSRIIRYREALGGFYDKNQLKEVYGVQDSLLKQLDSLLLFDRVELKKININAANADELKRHPYINWQVANSIVKIREQHGSYKVMDEIQKSKLINDSLYLKLKPYIKL